MKAHIVSLGCPKNLTDTEVLMTKLQEEGYTFTDNPSQAELILVNTCAFIKPAKEESIDTILELSKWKNKGKCKYLIAAGCLPQRYKHELPEILPEVDAFIGTPRTFKSKKIQATPPWFAYVKIAEGCSNRCSYCAIPDIRGKLVNRQIKDIVNEVKILAKAGVKEIILIAQDTSVYPHLTVLLTKISNIKGIRWIRLMYLHPAHLTDKLIDCMASSKRVLPYFDLPIQHACDKILKDMRRRYKRQDLENLIAKIRRELPQAVIRTSVIVGFPGEGEAEFKELLGFVKEVKFAKLGVFTYWKEEGTPAAKMGGQVSGKIKQQRLAKIMKAQSRISLERNKKLIGKTLETIIEGPDFGRTCMDAPEIDGKVFIKNPRSLKPGRIIKVKITGARTYDLIGRAA
ncbi:MAG: MiaB/RimO family radical SAM methylthiotransferase [Candidatus Margulisiibacteriota bacterium]|nr:MiaB/RimO family radical SAM methylthiotransferase [Candidatus Margulisiibacteriota bacterium]